MNLGQNLKRGIKLISVTVLSQGTHTSLPLRAIFPTPAPWQFFLGGIIDDWNLAYPREKSVFDLFDVDFPMIKYLI